MKSTIKFVFILIVLVILFPGKSLGEIMYKISGRAVYNGVGIGSIGIDCDEITYQSHSRVLTDTDGSFHVYVPNGRYILSLYEDRRQGYVSFERAKFITVDGKNVANVIFFLEKESKISGTVTFEDGTPITDVMIHAVNERSMSMEKTDADGHFLITGLRSSDNTMIKAVIPGVKLQLVENLVLEEGALLTNIDLVIPKNLSVSGVVMDKDSGEVVKDPVLVIADNENRIPVSLGADGVFTVYNLEKGQYVIGVYHPDYDFNTKVITFSGNAMNVQIDIVKKTE